MRKLIMMAAFALSCNDKIKTQRSITVGIDTFDLIQYKATVIGCERINPISIENEINPRYLILTTDSMQFKSSKSFQPGSIIEFKVYKKRK